MACRACLGLRCRTRNTFHLRCRAYSPRLVSSFQLLHRHQPRRLNRPGNLDRIMHLRQLLSRNRQLWSLLSHDRDRRRQTNDRKCQHQCRHPCQWFSQHRHLWYSRPLPHRRHPYQVYKSWRKRNSGNSLANHHISLIKNAEGIIITSGINRPSKVTSYRCQLGMVKTPRKLYFLG